MNLRTIDYLGIALFASLQIGLILGLGLGTLQYIAILLFQILLGAGLKLYNMYRMTPRERMNKKKGEGLEGLFC